MFVPFCWFFFCLYYVEKKEVSASGPHFPAAVAGTACLPHQAVSSVCLKLQRALACEQYTFNQIGFLHLVHISGNLGLGCSALVEHGWPGMLKTSGVSL